MIIDVATG